MLACNRFRLDLDDGSPVSDYRLENGCVEMRVLDQTGKPEPETGSPWCRLTPQQLTSHVMANTVVAQWLRRRMGMRPLLRACFQSAQ